MVVYPKKLEEINKWMKVPSAILMFEQYCQAYECQLAYSIPVCQPKYLLKALWTKSVDDEFNYETLETIGDSAIKFLVTFYLYFKFTKASEGEISRIRWRLINNFYLSGRGIASEIYYYLRQAPLNSREWICPLLNKRHFTKPLKPMNRITHKNVSDTFEAIVGAIFMSNEVLSPVFEILCQHDLFKDQDIIDVLINPHDYSRRIQNILFSKHKMFENVFPKCLRDAMPETFHTKQLIKMTDIEFQKKSVNEQHEFVCDLDDTSKICNNDKSITDSPIDNGHFRKNKKLKSKRFNTPLLQIKEQWANNKNSSKVSYEDFEIALSYDFLKKIEKKICYNFRDKQLLKRAFSPECQAYNREFERLEILGDSMFESYVLGPIIKTFDKNDIKYSPHTLTGAKIFFLSNKMMANFLVYLKLHKHIFISSYQQIEMIDNFVRATKKDKQL